MKKKIYVTSGFSFIRSHQFIPLTGLIILMVPYILIGVMLNFMFMNYLLILAVSIVVCVTVTYLFVSFLSNKNSQIPEYEHKYFRDIPSNLPPAIINSIYSADLNTINGIIATIADLVYRDYLIIRKKNSVKENDFLSKCTLVNNFFATEKEEYVIERNENKDKNQLYKFESFLIDWLFGFDENKKIISTLEIRDNLEKDEFSGARYEIFNRYIKLEIDKLNIFEKIKYYNIIINISLIGVIILYLLAILALMGINLFASHPFLYIVSADLLVVLIIISSLLGPDTYSNEYKIILSKFKAFKEFMKDFTNVEALNLEKVVLYEKFLIYSTALDLTNNIEQNFKKIFGKDLFLTK